MIRNTILTTYSIVHKTKTADSQHFPAFFSEKQQKPQILSNFVRNHDKSTVNLPYNGTEKTGKGGWEKTGNEWGW